MVSTRLDTLRWLTLPVVVLLAVLITQIVLFQLSFAALVAARGDAVGDAIWAAKTFASFFMGLAGVAAAASVAPAYKREVSLIAFGAVLLWGLRLATAAFEGGYSPWLLAMAVVGVLGGASALARARVASLAASA